MEVNGTLIWYYHICPREVWLMSHSIVPDQQDDAIDYGRFLHERSYKRNKKEIAFGNVKFDVLLETGDQIVIGETKKSSTYMEASKWQLLYYLQVLEEAGIHASGMLLYPEERKRIPVELDASAEAILKTTQEAIADLQQQEKPPKVKRCRYCFHCGYREYCYS